ncbi:MAG: glutathione S-transferase C-terminal domain-containing protein, partial [Pseudomonadota bacterium]
KTEDDLHLDLRAISMRYLFGPRTMRTEEQQEIYANTGSGTINGASDTHKDIEAQFFRDLATNKGVTDTQIVEAASQFKSAFDAFDNRLGSRSYLLGEAVSVLDIAWYIYAVRLVNAGYPLRRLHKNVGAWFDKLDARSEFHREVAMPPPLIAARDALHAEQERQGDSLEAVAGL